jgi:hypothetical protein
MEVTTYVFRHDGVVRYLYIHNYLLSFIKYSLYTSISDYTQMKHSDQLLLRSIFTYETHHSVIIYDLGSKVQECMDALRINMKLIELLCIL